MTHIKDKALDLALEALELHGKQYPHMVKGYCLDAITAIKQALAAPTVQPTAWPLATEEEKAGGWTLSYKFLESLSDRIDGRPAMETIESILMLTSSLTPPAQPAPVQKPYRPLQDNGSQYFGGSWDTLPAQSAPVQEPKMYEDWYDSSSCGHCGMVNGHRPECRHNYKTPAQPAPVQPVMTDEKGRPISFWGGKSVEPIKQPAPDTHPLPLKDCWFVNCFDFSQTPPYFRYDTDDRTAKENESELWEIQTQLREQGFELVDYQVEHDCITGYLSKVTQPAPVAFEVGLVEWVGNKLMATPKTTTTPQPSPVHEPVGTYGEIFESMYFLLRSGLQRDQQIYMSMKDKPLYPTPQQRPFVELTDEEIMGMYNEPRSDAEMIAFGREVEAELRSKNGY